MRMKAGWSAKGTKTTSEREQKRRGSWSLSHLVLLNPGDDSKASLEACERCAVSFGSVHLEKKIKNRAMQQQREGLAAKQLPRDTSCTRGRRARVGTSLWLIRAWVLRGQQRRKEGVMCGG